MMEGIGQAIGCLVTIAVIGIIATLGFTGYFTWDYFKEKSIESTKRITPEIQLTTDGKKVDTVFIYKVKKD
jgi:hypothetical protein